MEQNIDDEEDHPRKKSRSKRKIRKIEKKLMATTKRHANHKPSSTLLPLSQMIEEPCWKNELSGSVGKVSKVSSKSSEMSY